jgi:hypothetical protein
MTQKELETIAYYLAVAAKRMAEEKAKKQKPA